MHKDEVDPAILCKMREAFGRFPAVKLAYLFGSRVDGVIGQMSDYDFGVLVEDGEDRASLRAELAHELAVALVTDRIDVILLKGAPIEVAHAIIAQGVLICERDTLTRVEYEATVMSLYGDYLPVLRAQRADILRGDGHAARVQRYREAFRRADRTIGALRAAKGENQR